MRNLILILLAIIVVIYLIQKKESYDMLDSGASKPSMLNNQYPQRLSWETFAVGQGGLQGGQQDGQQSGIQITTTQTNTVDTTGTSQSMEHIMINTLTESNNVLDEVVQSVDCNNHRDIYNKVIIIKTYSSDIIDNLKAGTKVTPELITKVRAMVEDVKNLVTNAVTKISNDSANLNKINTRIDNLVNSFNKVATESFGLWTDVTPRLTMLNDQGQQRLQWEQFDMLNSGPGSGRVGMLNSQGPERLSWEQFDNTEIREDFKKCGYFGCF